MKRKSKIKQGKVALAIEARRQKIAEEIYIMFPFLEEVDIVESYDWEYLDGDDFLNKWLSAEYATDHLKDPLHDIHFSITFQAGTFIVLDVKVIDEEQIGVAYPENHNAFVEYKENLKQEFYAFEEKILFEDEIATQEHAQGKTVKI